MKHPKYSRPNRRNLDILLLADELPGRAIAGWLHLSPKLVQIYRVKLLSAITLGGLLRYVRRLVPK